MPLIYPSVISFICDPWILLPKRVEESSFTQYMGLESEQT